MRRALRGKIRFLLVLAALASGCGQKSNFCSVSGTVTFKTEPLPSGTIQFLTTGSEPGPAGGALIRDGEYFIPSEHGLNPGTYRVIISSPESMPALKTDDMSVPPAKERIPPKYNTGSTITVEVSARGRNVFDIDID